MDTSGCPFGVLRASVGDFHTQPSAEAYCPTRKPEERALCRLLRCRIAPTGTAQKWLVTRRAAGRPAESCGTPAGWAADGASQAGRTSGGRAVCGLDQPLRRARVRGVLHR